MMTTSECLAVTEIQDNGKTIDIPPEDNVYDPNQDDTLRAWQVIKALKKWDPMRPVHIFYSPQGGSPLILDIEKVTNANGHIQLVVE